MIVDWIMLFWKKLWRFVRLEFVTMITVNVLLVLALFALTHIIHNRLIFIIIALIFLLFTLGVGCGIEQLTRLKRYYKMDAVDDSISGSM